jgi:hypothetical protein
MTPITSIRAIVTRKAVRIIMADCIRNPEDPEYASVAVFAAAGGS